jgi:hypothetical protein
MEYLLSESDPYKWPRIIKIGVRALGIPKAVIVRREQICELT